MPDEMAPAPEPPGPPSLFGVTVRRAFVTGRIYLGIATAVSVAIAVVIGVASAAVFASFVPLLLPVYMVLAGMGGLMVFTSDRMKGVYEYLLAYGLTPRRLFLNAILASLVLVATVLGLALGVGLAVFVGRGNTVTGPLAVALALYTVPMSFTAVAFAATVGMYWSSVSSPREGLVSPVGLAPLVGVLPPLVTLFVGNAVGGAYADLAVVLALLVFVLVVLALIAAVDRLLPRERFLSSA